MLPMSCDGSRVCRRGTYNYTSDPQRDPEGGTNGGTWTRLVAVADALEVLLVEHRLTATGNNAATQHGPVEINESPGGVEAPPRHNDVEQLHALLHRSAGETLAVRLGIPDPVNFSVD